MVFLQILLDAQDGTMCVCWDGYTRSQIKMIEIRFYFCIILNKYGLAMSIIIICYMLYK
jgi:hypothetical protein